MRTHRMQSFFQKRTGKELLLSLFLLITGFGGIVLYILGAAEKIHLYKQLAILSFAAYFGLTWLYLRWQRKKEAPFFLIPAALLLLLLFLY